MIKARSRIFFLTYTVCWVFFFALCTYLICARPNQFASDRWRDNAVLVQQSETVSLIATILFGVIGAALLAIELAIRKGWEPPSLEVYRPGCTILSVEHLPGGKASVHVQFPNGEEHTFEADETETPDVVVGSISHLWVIGQFISKIKVLTPPSGDAVKVSRWHRPAIKPNSKPYLAWFIIGIATPLSGYFAAYGLIVAAGGSLVMPATNDLYEGTDIHMIGLTIALVSCALFAFIAYQWKKGWDESVFENLGNNQHDLDGVF